MKIKSTFTVTLEDPDGNAEFVFKKPKANKILDMQSSTNVRDNFYMLTEDLIAVHGLYDEQGNEVNAEQIHNLELDLITLQAIIEGYNAAAFPKKNQDQEKKIS